MEAYDGIQENIALVDRPEGSCSVVHSDSDEGIQRLNQEAAKAMSRGNKAGMDIAPERAIKWITSNAAKSLGIDDPTGSLTTGLMADVVIWSGNPFSVYAKRIRSLSMESSGITAMIRRCNLYQTLSWASFWRSHNEKNDCISSACCGSTRHQREC